MGISVCRGPVAPLQGPPHPYGYIYIASARNMRLENRYEGYTPIRKERFYHEIVYQLTKIAERIQTDHITKKTPAMLERLKQRKIKDDQSYSMLILNAQHRKGSHPTKAPLGSPPEGFLLGACLLRLKRFDCVRCYLLHLQLFFLFLIFL